MIIQPYIYFIPLNKQLSRVQFDQGLALGWLTEDEITKVNRYKAELAQHNALQVRLALRAVLSMHSDVLPHQWQFEYGDKGKPCLTAALHARCGLDFNLSHSGEWLMIGLLGGIEQKLPQELQIALGVDIERQRTSTHIHSILNHYFAQAEINDLLALPDVLQRQRFFDLWALKEAFIKATGKGLAQSLKSFSFSFNGNQVFQPEHSSEPLPLFACNDYIDFSAPKSPEFLPQMRWQYYFGRLTCEYRFSVCIGANAKAAQSAVPGLSSGLDDTSFSQPIMRLTTLAELMAADSISG
ncbi:MULTISPECIES: 4'-phosphopantetheinyl transferase family protein [Pseudomonadati]|nr:4'-phosphopantetheinyl transferase superfamily protein [Shewanella aestuarii]GGN68060.1 4'-phosphopantetheinyl transferase [Shewanella aestuarii]